MMTWEEQEKRLASVRRLNQAVRKARREKFNTASKLADSKVWQLSSEALRQSVHARTMKLFAECNAADELSKKLEKEKEKLMALPCETTVEYFNGRIGAIVIKGLLPDCTQTSEDEREAMQMLALYYANKGNTEELPF